MINNYWRTFPFNALPFIPSAFPFRASWKYDLNQQHHKHIWSPWPGTFHNTFWRLDVAKKIFQFYFFKNELKKLISINEYFSTKHRQGSMKLFSFTGRTLAKLARIAASRFLRSSLSLIRQSSISSRASSSVKTVELRLKNPNYLLLASHFFSVSIALS